ncbi:hypothetical protein [Luteolibacter soli]|uniref:Uncharacterized protein n=1 Tax=Luteolibacter soli TaxID=3135280 RepID=A0ABU9ARE6_9BACT
MNAGILLFLAVVLAPLVIGIALLLTARRLKKYWAKILTGLAGSASLMAAAFYLFGMGPYVWALHLESKWRPANPQTKSDLEAKLSGYSTRDIPPAQSEWGHNHKLEPGERMTRYSLLGAPLDVVFTPDDRIVTIYTSYE